MTCVANCGSTPHFCETSLTPQNLPACNYVVRHHICMRQRATIPHSPLSKRWTALSYHRVCEAIVAKILEFFHIPGEENPADIVSKHWSHNKVWHVLQPLLLAVEFLAPAHVYSPFEALILRTARLRYSLLLLQSVEILPISEVFKINLLCR